MADGPEPPSSPPPDPGEPAFPADCRQLVLMKRGQRYVFRYAPGTEHQLLETLVEQARDPESGLDWFDAAVLSHQMGAQLSQRLRQFLKSA